MEFIPKFRESEINDYWSYSRGIIAYLSFNVFNGLHDRFSGFFV